MTTTQSAWRWQREVGGSAIERWAVQWDALAVRYRCAPTIDALWTRCFWRAFGEGKQPLVLHTLTYQDELVAVIPLQRQGNLVTAWTPMVNFHTPLWTAVVAEDCPGVTDHVLTYLLDSCDYIDFYPLPREGYLCDALLKAAQSQGLLVVVSESDVPGDVVIDLSDPWTTFRSSLSHNLIKNTERQLRQLRESHQATFDVLTGRDNLSEVLAECFAVEASGWKGQRGTAISSQQNTLRFYTDLAHAAAARGNLAIYTLRAGATLIAFDLCLTSHERVDSLKASYHPDFAVFSPGNVLLYLELEREINLGRVHAFHLGSPGKWKLRWKSHIEPFCRLRIYSSSVKGQLAYYMGPKLRSLLVNSWTRPIAHKLRLVLRGSRVASPIVSTVPNLLPSLFFS